MNMIKTLFMISALLLSLTDVSMAAQSDAGVMELTGRSGEVGALRLINHPDPEELKVLHDLNLRIHT